jgi:hypothetical protein
MDVRGCVAAGEVRRVKDDNGRNTLRAFHEERPDPSSRYLVRMVQVRSIREAESHLRVCGALIGRKPFLIVTDEDVYVRVHFGGLARQEDLDLRRGILLTAAFDRAPLLLNARQHAFADLRTRHPVEAAKPEGLFRRCRVMKSTNDANRVRSRGLKVSGGLFPARH